MPSVDRPEVPGKLHFAPVLCPQHTRMIRLYYHVNGRHLSVRGRRDRVHICGYSNHGRGCGHPALEQLWRTALQLLSQNP